jgi:hypothetical protein
VRKKRHFDQFFINLVFRFLFHLLVTTTLAIRVTTKKSQNVLNCLHFRQFLSFDSSRFGGTWYEVFAYPDATTADGKCMMTSFGLLSGGKVYRKFTNSFGMPLRLMGSVAEIGKGIMQVDFPAAREFFLVYLNKHFDSKILIN